MRFTKPAWLCHTSERKDFEIYSLSVSPDGTRLATAAGDGHVRIWSTEAILQASNPAYTKPKQLASLSHHSGTVHSVRFSPNAKYLASGADDKIVCVYTLEPGEPSYATFGSKEQPPVENWRIFRRLIGHDNDVQDLGWSADSSILVSVGLDSKVVVWSGYTFEKLKTLSNHQSHVKGITFDPANKYFATASDDRTIKIYRFSSPAPNATAYDQTSNFTLEATVSAPFATSPLTTYFRRCSWSPEGAHIAAANATNGPVSSVAIIERGNWQSEINLIGHEGPVEVCAFSPRMFFNQPPPTPEQLQQGQQMPPAVSVIACAGQDKTISVWNTSFPRPFVTTAELSAKPISDLAWSPEGETLFAASLDGTIAALVFEKGELGFPSTVGDNEQRLAKYGAGRRAGIIEGADALRLEEGSKAGELKGVEGRMGELMGDAAQHATGGALTNGDAAPQTNGTAAASASVSVTTNGATNGTTAEAAPAVPIPPRDPQQDKLDKIKSRVTFTKDGKKRIAPLLVSSSNVGEANLPKPQLQASVRAGGTSDDPAGKTLDLSKPYDGFPKGGLASLLLGNKRKYAETDGDNDEERKRAEKHVQAVQATGATPIVNNTPDGLVPTSSATSRRSPAEVPEVLRPAIINPSLSVAQTRLAVPQVRTLILRPLDITKSADDLQTSTATTEPSNANANTDNDTTLVLEARNASGPSRTGRAQDREPARLSLTKRNQILWQDFLPRAILLTTGNRNFWAAACEDGSLHLWTPAGRRLVAPIILEAQAVILDCRGWWLMAITAVGMVYVWDVRKMEKKSGLPVSLAPVLDAAGTVMGMSGQLTASPALMFARMNSNGVVICGMSNGEGYAYNSSMGTWQRLSEGWWAVGSQYWNTLDRSSAAATTTTSSSSTAVGTKTNVVDLLSGVAPENISAGILPLLERHTTTHALLKGRAYFLQRLFRSLLSAEGYEGLETTVSISHLEHRLAATQMLGARDEFKVALVMYAKRIGSEGMRGRVEELLRGLMGPGLYEDEEDGNGDGDGGTGDGEVWGEGDEIVGWKREELLREVVVVLGRQRDLQRVTVPYARFLGILDRVPEVNGEGEEMVVDGG